MFGILIEIMFIGACFKVIKESNEQLKHDFETRDNFSIFGRQAIHIAVLVIFLLMEPMFPIVLLTFIALNVITLLWIFINKNSFVAVNYEGPAFINKMIPVAYILYFGFHLVGPFLVPFLG
jgi:hypothetical protein